MEESLGVQTMFARKSLLSGTGALDIALQNEKTKSLLIRREVKIVNELGLHARPAAEFVRAANVFRSQIWIVKGDERFSAKSIIEVLTANLNCGDTAIIEADGPDSESAIPSLAKLVSEFKDEDLKYGWNRRNCLEEDF
jgi:phosphotransferase system HPr (HPr) family protein